MWARGRQASHRWRAGSIPSRSEVADAEASTASLGEHHATGRPERAAGREHERVAGLDRSPPAEGAALEVRTDHGGGSELSGDGA